MMGIPIDCATHIYGESMSLINNTSKPEYVLQKKNDAECCHTVHESVGMGESLTMQIDGNENPAELFTKVLSSGKRMLLVNNILHDIYIGEFKQYVVAK